MIIDVSHHQGAIDWAEVARSGLVSAAIIRAGYGREVSQVDKQFLRNVQGCKAAGIPFGVYWYSYAESPADAAQESKACLHWLRQIPAPDLPVWFDMEEKSLKLEYRFDEACEFLTPIVNAGFAGGVYKSTLYAVPRFDELLERFPFYWQADYRHPPDIHPGAYIHQYTSGGFVPGIRGRVDCNKQLRPFPVLLTPATLEARVARLETILNNIKEVIK